MTITGATDYGPIPGALDWTASYGKRMVYSIDELEPSIYRVDLTFLEWIYSLAGQRPITVTINDQPMLKAFDIFTAGGYLKPVVRSMLIPAPEGKIVVVLTNDIGRSAILSGLTVTRTILD